MRIYKTDGSFDEYPNDTEFGWYLNEIVVENTSDFKEIEEENVTQSPTISPIEESLLESVYLVEARKPPVIVKKVDPKIKIQPVMDVLDCKMEIEGFSVEKDESKSLLELKNINSTIPSKEKMANLINPCNFETKMLMSIIYFAKYKSLMKHETSKELFKSVNYRTSNFKYLIKETNIKEEIYKEIQNYHAMKEDNMLSLMMELILTDLNCNLDDILDVNRPVNEHNNPQFVLETSDLGNSIPSSCSSKGENSDKSNYPTVLDRSSILSSIGLSDEDKSIQSLYEETFEMHSQLARIKKSFQEEEDRVNNLIKMGMDLQKDLKETLYLNDILHLLKGDIEKVKFKKLPFRIFHKEKEGNGELNLII
ncbi:hypothetical protein NQ314_012927 [Rhamnusium bicolor]|uniref:Uncharacterized protein n=1 Tax=Rhamnusium bicolor TaxID=1586634 RepID=A0AAV8X8T3_9CUCU|nr:hypothetical protein NQ314_012927 [Rhamnusium bicolor]